MTRVIAAISGVLIAVILGAVAYLEVFANRGHLSPAMLQIDGAEIGGPFELTRHTGQRVTSADLIDKPTLIYFGYTFCPDICPIDAAVLAESVDLLAERGIDVQPVFVTVDPARDTPEELGAFVEALHPEMVGLTGTEEDIRAAADAYKVYYQRVDLDDSAADYLMNHTGFTYLMTPEKGLTAIFRREFPPEQYANDIAKVLNAL